MSAMSEWDYMAKHGLATAFVTLAGIDLDDALCAFADYIDTARDAVATSALDVDALRAALQMLERMITDATACDACGAVCGESCRPDCLGRVA